MMELLLLEINSLFNINITYKINVDHVEVYFIFNKSKFTSDKLSWIFQGFLNPWTFSFASLTVR